MAEHDELETLVAGWVLGVLDPGDLQAVRAHLATCPICRETVVRLGRAVGVLPLGVEEITPPAGLRERILVAAAASRGEAVSPVTARSRQPRETRATKASPVRPRGWMPAYAAAAAVVIALLVGLVGGDLIGRGTPQSASVGRSQLVGHEGLAGARANVIDLKSDGVALVDFSGLPQVDPGRVYEIWLITPGGRADPAGVFVPDPNGSKFVLVNKPLTGYKVMAVTSEVGPAGTQAPTQQPQLYGNLA
jgi:anti-sigma-K factor RskA